MGMPSTRFQSSVAPLALSDKRRVERKRYGLWATAKLFMRLHLRIFQLEVQVAKMEAELKDWRKLKRQIKVTRDALITAAVEERRMGTQLRKATALDLPPNYSMQMGNEEQDY